MLRRALLAALLIAPALPTAALPTAALAHDAPTAERPDLPAVVQRVLPAVVTVLASSIVQLRADAAAITQQTASRGPAARPPMTERTRSVGSGFIIDPNGLVVTNNHVIEGADAIAVTLQDGTFIVAHLVGNDVPTDLALLKLDASQPVPALAFGDSSRVKLGQAVFAIGNPFGIGSSVTSGIVSALSRDIQEGPYDSFIQTDAPINRGNSGGPLFDMTGHVIGVNSAIYTPSGGSVGISFAIPANIARGVIDELDQHGYVPRSWLGAGVQQMTGPFAEGLGLAADMPGAIVAGVLPDSPAAQAGLRNGDVILRYNGIPVHDAPQLSRSVAMTAPGSDRPLVVWRGGQRLTLQVRVLARPHGIPQPRVMSAGMAPMRAYSDLGLTLAPMSAAEGQARGIPSGQGGVLVTTVASDSFATQQGVRPGDAILNVGQSVVNTPQEVWQQLAATRARKRFFVLLLLQNQGGLRWVDVPTVMPSNP
ncbi:MAG TPA: Do family serine endopeptidase [Acetobacteraceae bacterium]|nr:Do family serine endopeptidase [Acetobacteraceae bacterium]